MSKATFTFGRFNAPTETGHGKLVGAVQKHAEESGGTHYIFPSHTQDPKKNPLAHGDKVKFMRRLFPNANVVSQGKVRTAIDAMKHLESKGHTHVTMVVGSDRVKEFHSLLNKYRDKEFPKIKKVEVKSAGHRDPDAEGAEGMSASKLRALVAAGKRDEFVSHYSDKKLGAELHDKIKAGMQMESVNPVGIFLLGAPGSGKDYVLNNIFSRFDLVEVQIEHILNGAATELLETKQNIVINGALDEEKIAVASQILEGYDLDHVYVSVTNKVSRLRNSLRESPLPENKRLEKWYRTEKLAEKVDAFNFNNSINLNESSEFEKVFFADQITKLLERVTNLGLEMNESPEPKSFTVIREKVKEPTGGLKNACWKGYTAVGMKMKNGRKVPNCVPVKEQKLIKPDSVQHIADKHNVSVDEIQKQLEMGMKVEKEHTKDKDVARNIALNHLQELPDYYTRLKKAEKKPVKEDIDALFERQLIGTDEYRQHAIAMTPGQQQDIEDAYKNIGKVKSSEDCGCSDCPDCSESIRENSEGNSASVRKFSDLRKEAKETSTIDATPTLNPRKKKGLIAPVKQFRSTMDGMPTSSRLSEAKPDKGFMPTPRQIPAPKGGHPVPPGYERVKSWGGGWELRKIRQKPTTVKEAVEYHIENKISFTDNAFRPGSDMFFEMIEEAKKLYKEGKYTPADEFELDMLNSNIGEKAMFEGKEVILDYPFEEELNEEDKTGGKGIGKPWREGGGGAVYVRTGDGGVKKVRFSQSGMTKKFNDPAATRSFVARHHCLTNKDKTSASYWACRYPRFFSNSGKTWW